MYAVYRLLYGEVAGYQAVDPQGQDVALRRGDLLGGDYDDPPVVLQQVVRPELVVIGDCDATDPRALRVLQQLLHGGPAILGEHRMDMEIRFHLTNAPSLKSRLSTVM